MLVKEIMAKEPITVSADDPLKKVGHILKEKRISGMPVVDKHGELIGIITLTDVLKLFQRIYKWKELEEKEPELHLVSMLEDEKKNATVKDYMTKGVITLREDMTVDEAMEVMAVHSVHTLPVTREGKLVGIVGQRDLVYHCL